MKKKKLAAVMLCLLLTGALAGCGQDAGSTAEVTGGTTFTEDAADTQTTDAAQDMQAADDSGMHAGDLPAAGAGDAADAADGMESRLQILTRKADQIRQKPIRTIRIQTIRIQTIHWIHQMHPTHSRMHQTMKTIRMILRTETQIRRMHRAES